MDPYIAALRLFTSEGTGCRSAARALERYGSLQAIVDNAANDSDETIRRLGLALARPVADERTKLQAWQQQYKLYSLFAEDYPQRLCRLADPPLLLFVRGARIDSWPSPNIVIVGSRRASVYGQGVAAKFAQDLAQAGAAVGSGLAYGIDAAAHQGALQGGGFTWAAVGHGIDKTYPRDNRRLAGDLLRTGGSIISEYPPGFDVQVYYFPARNRILAALADAVVIVEGEAKSGSLITADVALDLGVPVLAVPGRLGDPLAEAPHSLLRIGAAPAFDAESILLAAGWTVQPAAAIKTDATASLPPDQRSIYEKLPVVGASHIDELARALGRPTNVLLGDLLQLELAGVVRALPGKFFSRASQ